MLPLSLEQPALAVVVLTPGHDKRLKALILGLPTPEGLARGVVCDALARLGLSLGQRPLDLALEAGDA